MGADVGFYMSSGSEYILNNDISNCETGIYAFDLMFETLTVSGNRITNCDNGLYLVGASCIVTNNNLNNTVNINAPEGTESIFNITKTTGKNIIGGPYLGGNYWATPSGDGFSQTHSDNNGDGFADEPYKLDGSYNSVDYLPLIPLKTQVAAFSASPSSGKAPLKVQFYDKSTGSPASWRWSFGDGTYSTAKNPVHKYSKAGKYIVSLTVKNAKGSNIKTTSNYITVK
jgi:PKD repeat protein